MRNERYRKNAISVRERHNERKNEVYSNPDVLLEYSHNNVTFKACEAATYAQQFDRMVEEGVVSTRGLKPDAYVFDELVFDVNGLLANVPPQAVHEWKIGEKGCPHSAKAIVMNGRKAAEIPAYSRKYGYNLLESITDLRKLLRYLLKSLDRAQEYRQKGQHLYYASRNVGRPQKLKAVPCTQAMQDKIEALAVDSYRHKQKDGKVVYGKTYVLPDTADTDILLSAIFQDIEE